LNYDAASRRGKSPRQATAPSKEIYETFHATQIIRPTMNVFLIYAHAGPQSFNGAWFQTAQDTLRDAGHAGGFESRFQTGDR
jgi:hypothetical protein